MARAEEEKPLPSKLVGINVDGRTEVMWSTTLFTPLEMSRRVISHPVGYRFWSPLLRIYMIGEVTSEIVRGMKDIPGWFVQKRKKTPLKLVGTEAGSVDTRTEVMWSTTLLTSLRSI